MRVLATTTSALEVDADTIAVGVFEDDDAGAGFNATVAQLVRTGEARREVGKVAISHDNDKRFVVTGLGKREEFTAEKARVAASAVVERAKEIGSQHLCWQLPEDVDGELIAAGLIEGTVLRAYVFNEFKSKPDTDRETLSILTVSAQTDLTAAIERAAIISNAVNAARDLQNTPANVMTPTQLAARAYELADQYPNLTVEVWGREQIEQAQMGLLASVARGGPQEPALITLRYEPETFSGPVLGFVGKAVTFDTGGISIKPRLQMSDMKFDMSGGAAVLEATGAIAALQLPIKLVSVIGATENMPSGTATKPGDILRAKSGTTVEIINTDAEGRLVLSDCITHALDNGAERLVDIATLTGAISVTFGSTYAGVMSNDDDWCDAVISAGDHVTENVWRLPLHEEFAALIKSEYADILNAVENRKAGSITGAEFLHCFAGDTPWAHIDIAGVAYHNGRAYTRKGGAGWGVRLLVEVARRHSSST